MLRSYFRRVRAKLYLGLKDKERLIFQDCLNTIDKAGIIIALLEGPDADSGTCLELGYAYARGKYIIGVRTDFRASEETGLNLMLANVCSTLIVDPAAEFEQLVDAVVQAIKRRSVEQSQDGASRSPQI